MLDVLIDNLKKVWVSDGLTLNEPASEAEIQLFEAKYNIKLPADFRQYLLELNGMSETIGASKLWPLGEIIPLTVLFEQNPRQIRPNVDIPLPNVDRYFVFGDYGFYGGFWAIDLKSTPSKENSIVVAYSLYRYRELASSFQGFLKLFAEAPDILG